MEAMQKQDDGLLLRVRVQPKASRDAVILEPDGRIRVALTSPPVEGAANKALESVLAKRLKVSRSAVHLVRGEKSREKTVHVRGLDPADAWERLKQV